MENDFIKWLIIGIVLFSFIFEFILKWLNHKSWSPVLPPEAQGIYGEEEYNKAYRYHQANYRVCVFSSIISILILVVFLIFDGFALVDDYLRTFTQHPVLLSVLFFFTLGLAADILKIPLDLYSTFSIEEKFGFNRTTYRTWILDKIKGYLLAIILGGGLIAFITWIYYATGSWFWIISWAVMTVISLFTSALYTSLLVPVFNKLTPLEPGPLKEKILEYCNSVKFRLDRVFVMDGSKRSNKGNAFFSGLGPRKSIVLFDTLIEKNSDEELVAVLAHEAGHYKLQHVTKGLIVGVVQSFFVFLLLGITLKYPLLSHALGSENHSFHLAIVAFGLLFTPVSVSTGIFANLMSRRHEFEADAYAKETYNGESLTSALKNLSKESLTNLTPHPAYVFVNYSHPPVLERIKRLK